MKSPDEQLELLRRGVDQIEPADGLKKKLEKSVNTGKPLRVKYGIDPTGIDVHLGHTVPLRKLRLFQELGHQAVLIIGNYTALVGDPSGRDETRARLTPELVEKNAQDYLAQISKILDMSKTEVRPNGEWFSRMTFLDVLSLTSKITVQRMLERDDFSKRFRAQPESIPIYLHECLYPLMQGHDSVEIKADIELGGSEQLFNLMMGRRLQEADGQEPQVCVTLPILRGLDGKRRMGKSLGNYVGVGESADDQFGKTMSIPDELMREWFTLLTDRPMEEITQLALTEDEIEQKLPPRSNPMEAKKALAHDVVAYYHGADEAPAAQQRWVDRFSNKKDPDNIPEVTIPAVEATNGMGLLRLLVAVGFCKSNNEARQKVTEGAVSIGPDRTKLTDPKTMVTVEDGLIVRLGS
ncbi:MAG TPA: tyrosine--tRNA ligase, partial [Gemmataceae bacterium]|nr:tyrosine--tRNA ligase [Gemmataceae bacterium]